jgi:hypothetical protein
VVTIGCLAVLGIGACSDKPHPQRTHVDTPVRAEPQPPSHRPRHPAHEHAHGPHPHPRSDHHHHPHPHPHLEGPNGHHHPY